MCKKIFIISLSIVVILFLSASISSVNAGGKPVKINWRVAGSMISEVVTTGDPYSNQSVINLKARGAPGSADLTILGAAGDPEFYTNDPNCYVYVPFIQDEFVAVFNDLSLLFAKLKEGGDAYVCVCVDPPQTTFKFDMEIFGGTGRFEGATGEFTATGVGHGGGFDGPLSAESGRFKGKIFLNKK
jgi:hypothetical protein